jgi:hypothetical protein
MPNRHTPALGIRHKLLQHHLHVLARRVVIAARAEEQVKRRSVVARFDGRGYRGGNEGVLGTVGILGMSKLVSSLGISSHKQLPTMDERT